MRKFWTAEDEQIVRWLYPHVASREIARVLERSVLAIYQAARRLCLHKTAAYLASAEACRLRRGDQVGKAWRFKPGQTPANKGLRRPGWAPGRMASTQFVKGGKPHTWQPIGSTRFSKEGYLQRKVTDTGYPPKDWVGEHILLWRAAHGPVPASHAVAFKNGDKAAIRLDNLELISRAELMRRNTIHNLPPELAEVCRLRGVLKRTITSAQRRKDGRNTQQNVGSAESPVCHDRGSAG